MKKFIFSVLCLVLLSSCCGVQEEATREEPTKTVYKTKEAETFVNPIFYKTMYPISKMTWKTNLTPTEMVEENDENFVIKSYCTMLENKEDEITLKCTTIHPPSLSVYTLFYRFTPGENNCEKELALLPLSEGKICIKEYVCSTHYCSANDYSAIKTDNFPYYFYIDTSED
jgi:hypothetical protein